jgi:hypothetical protein
MSDDGRTRHTRPRSFCIVTETYPPEINGVAMTLGRLTAALRGRGHVVSIVRPRLRPRFSLAVAGETDTTWVPGAPMPGYRDVRLGWPATRRLDRAWTNASASAREVGSPAIRRSARRGPETGGASALRPRAI